MTLLLSWLPTMVLHTVTQPDPVYATWLSTLEMVLESDIKRSLSIIVTAV